MSVTTEAAKFGQLEILKFLKEKHCPWGIQAIHNAIVYKHVETIKWLIENKCPIDETDYNKLHDLGLYYEKSRLNIVV